jgi:glycosyltransferase involved in cell wall biosynthesis
MKAPRIGVLCPDYPAPAGGIRRLYRHVDVLCRHGFDAFILHDTPGFRCIWFENSTPVLARSAMTLNSNDFLVVPEVLGPGVASIAPGVPKVIFNQNAYLTFAGYPAHGLAGPYPYQHPDVVAVFCVSEDNAAYLRYAFPKLPLFRLRYGIDPLFSPHSKRRAIAYMPRKNAADVVQVLNLLRIRGALRGWELVPIDGLNEAQVAERLSNCTVFLSFGHPEGCPLPPLEAMASGCVLVGYHGRGGREYFDKGFSWPIEMGDVVNFARAAEEVLLRASREPSWLEEMSRRAIAHVRDRYSPEREEQTIVEIWQTILAAAPTI